MTLAFVGPTVLYIKAVPVRKLTELKIKSGLSDMIRSLLLKGLIVFNSILNLELLNFSVKMYKCIFFLILCCQLTVTMKL